MNKEQTWNYIVSRNPALANGGKVSWPTDAYRRLFDYTWSQCELHTRAEPRREKDVPMPDFLLDLFNATGKI